MNVDWIKMVFEWKIKKYNNQPEEEDNNIVNDPAVGYNPTPNNPDVVNQQKAVAGVPRQYSAKQFDEYLDAFESDLSKDNDCFYSGEEVIKMMGKW